jgi:hypothetical protein
MVLRTVVRVSGERDLLVWGRRSLMVSMEYLSDIVTDGRLRAKSEAMRSVMGSIVQHAGEDFNYTVAEIVDGILGGRSNGGRYKDRRPRNSSRGQH